MDSDELARRIGLAWEKLPEPRHPVFARNHHARTGPRSTSTWVRIRRGCGPRIWTARTNSGCSLQENFGSRLHHRDVVGVALRRLQKDLEGERRTEALDDLGKDLPKQG